jgi:orotate phosphoribosyltransferase
MEVTFVRPKRAPNMTEAETDLFELLKERSFRNKGGPFRLASGELSEYYIDGKMTVVSSAGVHLIGEVLYEHTRDLDIDAIGGLEVGAVPLVAAAVGAYHRHGRTMEGFWVRNTVKAHGTQKLIEGDLKERMRVVIVDDVFTQGKSALKAADAARDRGCEVALVLALVDRLRGAEALFRSNGYENYQSVFTIRDFGVAVDAGSKTEVATR